MAQLGADQVMSLAEVAKLALFAADPRHDVSLVPRYSSGGE